MTEQPTREQAEQQLTAALKMIVDEFVRLGFEDTHIFGKVNLIINKFITDDGDFSPEYVQLARQALEYRESQEFKNSLLEPDRPQNDGSGIGLIIPGGGVKF